MMDDKMVQQNQKIEERMDKIKHKIAVASGKGGVGKSLVAGLIASYLAKNGNKVGILDADITGPSIPKMFGVDQMPAQGQEGIVPPISKEGIKVMSLSLVLHDNSSAVIWRGPMVANAIRQFMSDIEWGDLDYLIIDLPPGTSDAPLTVMQGMKLDGTVVVTSPQQLAFEIVRKAISMSKTMNVRVLGIIQNMAYALCPKCGEKFELFGKDDGENLAKLAEVPYLGSIPLDSEISRLADNGLIGEYDKDFVDSIAKNILEKID